MHSHHPSLQAVPAGGQETVMSISSLNTGATAAQTTASGQASSGNQAAYSAQTAKDQLNATLVASLNVSISISGSNSNAQSQALLFRTAIDQINQILGQELGGQQTTGSDPSPSSSNGTSNTQASGFLQQNQNVDTSPEATAKRILDGATGFFSAYAQQHPEMSASEQATSFVSLVQGGFEQGYQEASGILKNLNVLNGSVASDIQKTHDLVTQGFADFLSSKLGTSSTTASQS